MCEKLRGIPVGKKLRVGDSMETSNKKQNVYSRENSRLLSPGFVLNIFYTKGKLASVGLR